MRFRSSQVSSQLMTTLHCLYCSFKSMGPVTWNLNFNTVSSISEEVTCWIDVLFTLIENLKNQKMAFQHTSLSLSLSQHPVNTLRILFHSIYFLSRFFSLQQVTLSNEIPYILSYIWSKLCRYESRIRNKTPLTSRSGENCVFSGFKWTFAIEKLSSRCGATGLRDCSCVSKRRTISECFPPLLTIVLM